MSYTLCAKQHKILWHRMTYTRYWTCSCYNNYVICCRADHSCNIGCILTDSQSGGMADMSSQLWNNHSVKCEPWKDNECLTQGWASFSHEGPDLEKLLKPRAARWLKNKVKTSSFWRSQYTYDCDLQNIRSSPRFLFQFCTVEAYFVENHCYPWSLKDKKVIRSIQDESLSLRKCRRARIKGPAGRIWPVVCRCLL